MDKNRRTGWMIVGLCALLLGVSVAGMVGRIRRFNQELAAKYPQYRFEVGTSRQFKPYGRQVTLTDLAEAGEGGRTYLVVKYGDTVEKVPVKAPPAPDLPDLGAGYNEWVKVLDIYEVEWVGTDGGGGPNNRTDKPGSERLVLVSRRTPEGYDPQTWGTVFRDNWTFDIYQFNQDGTIGHETFRWPRSRTAESVLADQARKGDAVAAALLTIPPLQERTWQYQAALHVIPRLNVPKHRFENDAFSPHVLGWTLPVGMLSVLAGLVGLFMAVSPRRPAPSQR